MFFTMTMLLVFCVKIASLITFAGVGAVAGGEEGQRRRDALRRP